MLSVPSSPEPPKPSPTIVQPARPEVYNFRFSADEAFKHKLDRLAEVVGVVNAQAHMAELLEQALDIALEKKDPQKKLERRRKRKQRTASAASPRSNDVSAAEAPTSSRHVPSELAERLHERGDYRCEYRSREGRRCTARAGLQLDHVRPFARSPRHDERLMRLLCPAHNRLEAERVYGKAFIQRKIAQSRQARASP